MATFDPDYTGGDDVTVTTEGLIFPSVAGNLVTADINVLEDGAGTAELESASDRFLTYLTTTAVPLGRSKEDLFMVIRVLTTLHANRLPMDEKVTLAERLQDPTLTFQTKFVADMIPDIAAALLK